MRTYSSLSSPFMSVFIAGRCGDDRDGVALVNATHGAGVGLRGSERAPGGKMLRTAPWQDKEMCAGDLHAARMRVESKHVTASLGVIADVRRTHEWAEAALAACGFGKTMGEAVAVILNVVSRAIWLRWLELGRGRSPGRHLSNYLYRRFIPLPNSQIKKGGNHAAFRVQC